MDKDGKGFKQYALACLDAYESLEFLENEGNKEATKLREYLFEMCIDTWEEIKPMVNR